MIGQNVTIAVEVDLLNQINKLKQREPRSSFIKRVLTSALPRMEYCNKHRCYEFDPKKSIDERPDPHGVVHHA